MKSPNELMYTECLQHVFNVFNEEFFRNELPMPLFVLQRKRHVMGHFCQNRYKKLEDGSYAAEIAINPEYISNDRESQREALQTLAHEMLHFYEHHSPNMKKPRSGYHTKAFSLYMRNVIGLKTICLDPDKTRDSLFGQKMSDEIIEGSRFDILTNKMLDDGFRFTFIESNNYKRIRTQVVQQEDDNGELVDVVIEEVDPEQPEALQEELPPPPRKTRTKFECPDCLDAFWGKDSLQVCCLSCSDFSKAKIVAFMPVD